MFDINQIVVKKDTGVYLIVGKENIDLGLGLQEYLVLKPYFRTNKGSTYLPSDKADEFLRYLISKEEAEDVIKSIPSLERFWINDPKQRKNEFDRLAKTGDLKNYCLVIKSIYLQAEDLRQNRKMLSTNDRNIYDKLKNAINEEMSLVLDMKLEDVEPHIISIVNEEEKNSL